MTMTESVACPKCGGPTWDNRLSKKNPKQPDFKCRDREGCDGVIWPPKDAPRATAPAARPAPAARQPISAGPHIPGLDPAPAPVPVVSPIGRPMLTDTYIVCLDFVLTNAVPRMNKAGVVPDASAIAAMTATLFIAAKERGI